MDRVGSSDVIEGVHVVDGGAVIPAGQQVSGSDHGHLLRLEELPNPAVECGQILHDLLTGVHGGGIGAPDVGAVLQVHAAGADEEAWDSFQNHHHMITQVDNNKIVSW